MKRGKIWIVINLLLIMVMVLSGCSSKADNMSYNTQESGASSGSEPMISTSRVNGSNYDVANDSSEDGTDYGVANNSEVDANSTTATKSEKPDDATGVDNSVVLTSGTSQPGAQDKIIKNYYLDVETQDFDQLIKDLNNQINSLGGYVESSSISGKSYYNDDVTRSGSIVARIPGKSADEFVNTVDETSNVTNNQSSSENVTLQYVDTQSRIEALKTEEDRLFAILEKAVDLDSVITLESRLSDIRYELQNYESQLRVFDNQVQYSTVTLSIREVERITPDTKVKPTFGNRIKNGFSDTLYQISDGLKNFVVWFIVNLPYLLIWGAIIFVIVLIVRKYIKKAELRKNIINQNVQQNTDHQNKQ